MKESILEDTNLYFYFLELPHGDSAVSISALRGVDSGYEDESLFLLYAELIAGMKMLLSGDVRRR